MGSYYDVLGIPEGASAEQVRDAYRRLVKTAHPDVAGDAARFRLIAQAYAVLSDPSRRAAYDRSRAPASIAAPPKLRRRRYGRYVLLLVVLVVVAGIAWLAVATGRQSVGDGCLVGAWRGDAFEVPFRGRLDGNEVDVPIHGGAGVTMKVGADGTVRADYAGAEPLVGSEGAYRVEGDFTGRTIERWQASGGRVKQTGTDASALRFQVTIDGRQPDQPVSLTVVDGDYPYTCTPKTLQLGPYRYSRVSS